MLIAFELESEKLLSFLILCEIAYLVNIFVESLKSYDPSGQGVYETRWRLTSRNYWKTADFKVQIVTIIPFGLIG